MILDRVHALASVATTLGVQAVLVYPMNALINSQVEELERYAEAFALKTGRPFPIRFASYTGQLREEDREPLRENPPDILLTNYMMLELLLTRRREQVIRDSMYANLRFLVFDELHTNRGRQGADVGLLVRRIRSKSALRCVPHGQPGESCFHRHRDRMESWCALSCS